MGPQQRLFETEPAPWEWDEQAEGLVASVVFPTGPEKVFDYLVPERLRRDAETGRRVRAPFGRGNRVLVGYCVRLENRPVSGKLKELLGVVDRRTLLSPHMVRLTKWMAEHYLCPWGTVLEAVLPAGVRGHAGTRNSVQLSVPEHVVAKLDSLKLSAKQAQALEYLAASREPMTPAELAAAVHCKQGPIDALRKRGLVRVEMRRVMTGADEETVVARERHLDLNPQQVAALDEIRTALTAESHRTILIHGVTGSGKTEVYIQAIEEVVQRGRQAIVLVPEISLTPQTRARFRSRFDRVAVLHSHLSDVERHRHWEEIARGGVQVVVGARSAIFAPTPGLGLIVLDEEHESSFKQETAPRYHARDVALERARMEGIPLILGSATPSLESWYRAQRGEYTLVSMPRRIHDRLMPRVATVDLRTDVLRKHTRGAISRQLHQAMVEALEGKGQVILLLNRRGFATHIQCPACGLVVKCPHCEVALTHHRREELAICHYCDYRKPSPAVCPDCGFIGIQFRGLGTQRLEVEVRKRFPDATCLRMDSDTMRGPGSHERALAAFREGEVQILLGTQMIAKGLDFPNVTLVGVINADTAMHFPDFRAAERTFQLVTQVAGRTGRSERGGRVLVQTFSPDHPAMEAAVRHDYDRFAKYELPIRQTLNYPPFGSMLRIVVRGPIEAQVAEFSTHVTELIAKVLAGSKADVRVLGPAPAPIAKLRGQYRYHLQLQGTDTAILRAAVREALDDLKAPDRVQWIVDVDPLEMM